MAGFSLDRDERRPTPLGQHRGSTDTLKSHQIIVCVVIVDVAVRACRRFNTALDVIFYDVPTLTAQLAERDAPMQTRGEKPPSRIVQFDALDDP